MVAATTPPQNYQLQQNGALNWVAAQLGATRRGGRRSISGLTFVITWIAARATEWTAKTPPWNVVEGRSSFVSREILQIKAYFRKNMQPNISHKNNNR